jgi:nucleotide-binding universal stress UspA family protein
MKKILVPCDFSRPAINAFRFALDIAVRSKGTVHLLNVVELPVLQDSVLTPVLNFDEALLVESRIKAEKAFSKMIAKYNTGGVNVKTRVVFGLVLASTSDFIEENKIDLVVMGSHGASGVREFFMGSNAERIVRNSIAPVLVIKDYRSITIKNIVFPNALEADQSDGLGMKVKALQTFFKAHLNIVWINTPLNFASDSITTKRLGEFARRFKFRDCSIHIFNHRDEEQGILEFADLKKGDLIAMATHGRKGIAHLLNGSLAEDVANHIRQPVWTYSLRNEAVEP